MHSVDDLRHWVTRTHLSGCGVWALTVCARVGMLMPRVVCCVLARRPETGSTVDGRLPCMSTPDTQADARGSTGTSARLRSCRIHIEGRIGDIAIIFLKRIINPFQSLVLHTAISTFQDGLRVARALRACM